jgi:asparaginyl-tRNA synthetase
MDKNGHVFVPQIKHMLSRSYSLLAALPPTIKQVLSSYSNKGHHEHEHAITTVHGWIKSVRRQKNVSFAVVNDGTTLKGLQAVFLQPETEQAATMKRLTTGTSVRLTGKLIKSLGKGQDCELRVDMVEVLGDCEPEVILPSGFFASLS